jgi:glycosyl transferase family 87
MGLYGDGLGLGGPAYLVLLGVAFLAYLVVLRGVGALPARLVWGAIAALVLLFALAPPLLSQDVFSYISYARLDAAHGLNPYDAVPLDVRGDGAFPYVGWRRASSAYGPLFAVATLPLGKMSVPAALWTLKALAALSVLAVSGLAARVAARRGVDPRWAAALVALNPLVLVHVVGGAHNDGLMMALVMVGVAAILAGRELAGGAGLIAGAAIKVSGAFAAPFAALGSVQRGRVLSGMAIALLATVAISAAAFGSGALEALGIAGENQQRTSHYSVPSMLSRLAPIDVDVLRVLALAAFVLLVILLCVWVLRGADWVRAAGWAALGLLLATGWLLPWYVIWALPLAAVARDPALLYSTLALTAYQLVNRVPL